MKFKLVNTSDAEDPIAQCPECKCLFNIINAWGDSVKRFCPNCGLICTEIIDK